MVRGLHRVGPGDSGPADACRAAPHPPGMAGMWSKKSPGGPHPSYQSWRLGRHRYRSLPCRQGTGARGRWQARRMVATETTSVVSGPPRGGAANAGARKCRPHVQNRPSGSIAFLGSRECPGSNPPPFLKKRGPAICPLSFRGSSSKNRPCGSIAFLWLSRCHQQNPSQNIATQKCLK